MSVSESNFDANDARRARQKKMGGPEGVASFVASELREKSRELGYLCGKIYMLSDAIAYHSIKWHTDYHSEDEWYHACDIDPRSDEKCEAMGGIAEEIGSFGIRLGKEAERLKDPEASLPETAHSVDEELEEMSKALFVLDDEVGVVRRALMYNLARIDLVKAERKCAADEGAGKVYGGDLHLGMESEPVVKQLGKLSEDLFAHAGWLDELSRRLRVAFPEREG